MKRAPVVLFAVAAMLAVPALAQTGDQADDFAPVPELKALAIAHGYATCLVDKRPKEAREILSLDFHSEVYRDRLAAMAKGKNNCMEPGKLRVAGVLLAGALAEAAFEHDFGGYELTRLLPGDWTTKPIAARSESEVVALCLVQRDGPEVRALLKTQPSSDAEKTATGKLAGKLQGCLSQGVTMRMNRPMLRAMVALALYRSARHFSGQDV